MWPFKRRSAFALAETNLEPVTGTALGLALVSLLFAAGALRWSWAVVDEQVRLRKDLNDMQSQVDQLKIQFDYWDQKAAAQRAELRAMLDDAKAGAPKK